VGAVRPERSSLIGGPDVAKGGLPRGAPWIAACGMRVMRGVRLARALDRARSAGSGAGSAATC